TTTWRGGRPDEGDVHGQRPRGDRRGRVGGREPAVRAARAAGPARLQERLRTGRVRLLHRLPGRPAGLRLPGRRRSGAGPRSPHRRGPGRRGRARSDPGGVRGGRRGPVRLLHARPARPGARPARTRRAPVGRGDPRGAGGQPVPLHRVREDPGRRAAGRRAQGGGPVSLLIENACIAPVAGPEIERGWILVAGDRTAALGPMDQLPAADGAERIDATGCLATPGLVNTHHHLYQWASQGLAQDATLFEWLVALYQVWAAMDAEV